MFKDFSQAVTKQFNNIAKGDLYIVEAGDLFQTYLGAFPEGTDPMFRERTEHDCQYCKNFINNVGAVVSIDNGVMNTVWDCGEVPYPYSVVAERLADAVKKGTVKSVFRTTETVFGRLPNVDAKDLSITWHHLFCKVPIKFVATSPGSAIGTSVSQHQVLSRGLNELAPEHFDTVLDLIANNSIYRGAELKNAVKDFQTIQQSYLKLKGKDSKAADLFVWEKVEHWNAGFRNTVIGTLLVDLSDGDALEDAVKKFEKKVDPTNYKRPTSLITPVMIEKAVYTLKELGLEDAVERRLACFEDLSINDVLFVDNSVASKMKDSLTDLLMSSPSVKKPKKAPKDPTDISVEDFIALGNNSVELILGNEHLNNFVTLTAPVHSDVEGLFKWNNSFGWSYDGGVTDTMRDIVVSRGGRVDGVFRFTHQWNYGKRNASLMDLHVFMPGSSEHRDGVHDNYPKGRRVGWNSRNDHLSEGVQDVDYTAAAPEGYVPIENITFPSLSKMPEGKYICKIHNWSLRRPTEGGFKAEIEFEGQVYEYEVDRPLKNKEWVTVAEVTLRNSKFSIEHKLPTSSSSREKWGVATQVPVKVQTILLSPNHWENANKTGNKHWFFILENCKTPEPVRGIYNEFLVSDLEPHRKVFEVLGSKTKCPPAKKQLSGVGFSSTRKDKVLAVADGRPYVISF